MGRRKANLERTAQHGTFQQHQAHPQLNRLSQRRLQAPLRHLSPQHVMPCRNYRSIHGRTLDSTAPRPYEASRAAGLTLEPETRLLGTG
jgi:hypothetical protein